MINSPARISALPLGTPTGDDFMVFVDELDDTTKKALISELFTWLWFVPYTGATEDLDLGLFGLIANSLVIDGTTLVVDPTNNAVLLGSATAISVNLASSSAGTPALQLQGTGGGAVATLNSRFIASGLAATNVFAKSRGTMIGENIIVQIDDSLGNQSWVGADGNSRYYEAARIRAVVAAATAWSISGRLEFMTTGIGNTTSATRMSITELGRVGIGTTTPGQALELAGNGVNDQVLRLNNTDSTLTALQQLGAIEFYANDSNTNGVGVMAKISGYTASSTGNFGNLWIFTGADATLLAERITILASWNIGMGTTAPTATLHLKAGTATAGTAPIKLTPWVSNTASEPGAMEFDGSFFYLNI